MLDGWFEDACSAVAVLETKDLEKREGHMSVDEEAIKKVDGLESQEVEEFIWVR